MSLLGGVIGSLVGGIFGKKQADRAADASVQGAQMAVAEQRRQYDLTRQDQQPWMQAGQNALAQLQDPQTSFQQSPGFNWLQQQGMRGIERSAAARGGGTSGNALKALAEFNTGLAQQDFGNWWNRTAGVAGVGQQATNMVGGFGQQTAGNVGNALIGAGDARASGIVGGANALSQGVAGAFDAYNYFRKPRQKPQPNDGGPMGGGYGTGW